MQGFQCVCMYLYCKSAAYLAVPVFSDFWQKHSKCTQIRTVALLTAMTDCLSHGAYNNRVISSASKSHSDLQYSNLPLSYSYIFDGTFCWWILQLVSVIFTFFSHNRTVKIPIIFRRKLKMHRLHVIIGQLLTEWYGIYACRNNLTPIHGP